MKKILCPVLLIAVILFSCSKNDNSSPDPIACFTVDASETIDSVHNFLFDQCPPAYDLSYWDFGDGQYSSNPNPSHAFNHYGSYNAKLTVTDTKGKTSTTSKTITVGHYSLDKIVYTQTWASFTFPKSLQLYDSAITFWLVDTITSQASLPYTRQLSDNSIYDLLNVTSRYGYGETSSGLLFNVNSSLFTNKKLDVALPSAASDTAKFTLFYKIVPR